MEDNKSWGNWDFVIALAIWAIIAGIYMYLNP